MRQHNRLAPPRVTFDPFFGGDAARRSKEFSFHSRLNTHCKILIILSFKKRHCSELDRSDNLARANAKMRARTSPISVKSAFDARTTRPPVRSARITRVLMERKAWTQGARLFRAYRGSAVANRKTSLEMDAGNDRKPAIDRRRQHRKICKIYCAVLDCRIFETGSESRRHVVDQKSAGDRHRAERLRSRFRDHGLLCGGHRDGGPPDRRSSSCHHRADGGD